MIYFTSDLHFGHKNIIEACNRPFGNTEEMNGILIKNWNKKVKAKDEIYILGDLFWKEKDYFNILPKLDGKKYLILGNHERNCRKIYKCNDLSKDFIWIKDYYILKYQKKKIILFHYPIYNWDGKHRGSVHLHGHSHNKALGYTHENLCNVGVDCNNYYPISITDVLNKIKRGR